MKINNLQGLGSKIGTLVGHSTGHNLDLGSIPGVVVPKPVLQRLTLELTARRWCPNLPGHFWPWNYVPGGGTQTYPATSELGTMRWELVPSPNIAGLV